ncbi:MAG TPA: hypothetical protein DEF75_13585 [Comamonas kerstersii]|nr:hypothetical protein [Comamonas kerstersii]
MRIKKKTFNLISVLVGLGLTAAVAHDMATNPRWAGDNGPGVGKLPRDIVQGFMQTSYQDGQAALAIEQYMTPKTVDQGVPEAQKQNGQPVQQQIRRLLAEGLQVTVWHCLDLADGSSQEVVDFFATRNGRIQERVRALSQQLPEGVRCTAKAE